MYLAPMGAINQDKLESFSSVMMFCVRGMRRIFSFLKVICLQIVGLFLWVFVVGGLLRVAMCFGC